MERITNADVAGAPSELKAQLAFVTWLNKRHPQIYNASVRAASTLEPTAALGDFYNSQMGGFFDSISSAVSNTISKIDFGKLTATAVKAGDALLNYKAQRDILKLNIARAQEGQPPIDPTAYGPIPANTPPQTVIDQPASVANGLAANFDNYKIPLLIAAGAAAFFLLNKRR